MKPVYSNARPWWKEPWPWILMAGPALAMVGCFVTIFLAVTHDDPSVAHSKRGLVIEQPANLAPAEGRGNLR